MIAVIGSSYWSLLWASIIVNVPSFTGTSPYLEPLLPVVHLDVQTVWPVPVAVDDVCLAVAVEVSQGDAPAVLHGVLQTYSTNTSTPR